MKVKAGNPHMDMCGTALVYIYTYIYIYIYAQSLILVSLILVNFFDLLVITRHNDSFEGRH